MAKNRISINEIDLETLIDYMDRDVIERDASTPNEKSRLEKHVDALRDYYYNMDGNGMDYVIESKTTSDDYGKTIILAEPIADDSGIGKVYDANSCQYTIKTMVTCTETYSATKLDNPTADEIASATKSYDNVALMTADLAQKSTSKVRCINMLKISNKGGTSKVKTSISTKMDGGISATDESFGLPTKAKLIEYVFGSASRMTGTVYKVGSSYYAEKVVNDITEYSPDTMISGFSNMDTAIDSAKTDGTFYVSTYYGIRGSLLEDNLGEINDQTRFFENLEYLFENGCSITDSGKVSAYRTDYLDNAKVNLQSLFDLYSEEKRLYEEYMVTGKLSRVRSYSEMNDYEHIILVKPETTGVSEPEFSEAYLTESELAELHSKAEAVNPYIRIREYDRYSTIEERYRHMCMEAVAAKMANIAETGTKTYGQELVSSQNSTIKRKGICKSDFKSYMKNLMLFYFYGDESISEHKLTKTGEYYSDENTGDSISRYLSSHNRYYYSKINSASADNISYDDDVDYISVYTLYHDKSLKSYNDLQMSGVEDKLSDGWRIM